MGLQSRLFRGDPKLEAAAVSDPAHIAFGASGPHVSKIQTALILLDGAVVDADEMRRTFYGDSTAGAVLAYKRKRDIVNRSYQTQPDNIVGKMTMASFDDEMQKREALSRSLCYESARRDSSTGLMVKRRASSIGVTASPSIRCTPR